MLRQAASATTTTAWWALARPASLAARLSSSAGASASGSTHDSSPTPVPSVAGGPTLAAPPAKPTVLPDAGPALRDARAAHKAAMTGE